MRNSSAGILTSHAGSLPRPQALLDANRARTQGQGDDRAFQETLRGGVAEVMRRQQEIGIDVPNDGEFGKSMDYSINYRRLVGLRVSAPVRPEVAGTDAGYAAAPGRRRRASRSARCWTAAIGRSSAGLTPIRNPASIWVPSAWQFRFVSVPSPMSAMTR